MKWSPEFSENVQWFVTGLSFGNYVIEMKRKYFFSAFVRCTKGFTLKYLYLSVFYIFQTYFLYCPSWLEVGIGCKLLLFIKLPR